MLLLLSGIAIAGLAQNSLKGRVTDDKGTPLENTTVVLLSPQDSTMQNFGITNAKGDYQIRHIKKGNYIIQFSYVGMVTIYENIVVPIADAKLKDKIMKPSLLDEVVVVAEIVPMKFKTDTLEYNTKAFKTRPGASVEELLKKLPGVEVDENGNVKAQGEGVTKVLVNGKEFFGNDLKVATKNLPAKALKKVQVFDRKSEETNFSGIDDGVRNRTINLLLNKNHKNGWFGNLMAGTGTNETYIGEGKIYQFSGTTQLAALGQYNNINEFGFTNKGNQEFGGSIEGLNTSVAGGLNLSYTPSLGNHYFVSYLGNSRKKELQGSVNNKIFLKTGTYRQLSNLTETEKNQPHSIDFGINHYFNKKNKLVLKGNLSVIKNDLESRGQTESGLNLLPVNNLDNVTFSGTNELKLNTALSYMSKFNDKKTQFKIRTNVVYDKARSEINWMNATTVFDPLSTTIVMPLRNNFEEKMQILASPALVRTLGKGWAADAGVRLGATQATLNRLDDINGGSTELSNDAFHTNLTFVRPFLSVNKFSTKNYFNLSLEVASVAFGQSLQNKIVDNAQYFYFLPRLYFRSAYRSGRKIELRFRSLMNMPATTQLFPVANTINQLMIYQGNTELKPEYSHQANLVWSVFDQFTFTSFFVRLTGNYTQDKISWAKTVSNDLIQTTTPVNTDYQYNISSSVNYSAPLRFLGTNVRLASHESFHKTKVFINKTENLNTIFNHTVRLSFENRNRDVWRINMGGAVSLMDTRFSIAQNQNNTFLNSSYFGSLGFTPAKKWNFEVKANVLNYSGQSFDNTVSVPLLTAEISYSFLQAEKASVTLSGFDLLNQNQGFKQISDASYLSQSTWNTLTRYFMLKLAWRMGK